MYGDNKLVKESIIEAKMDDDVDTDDDVFRNAKRAC